MADKPWVDAFGKPVFFPSGHRIGKTHQGILDLQVALGEALVRAEKAEATLAHIQNNATRGKADLCLEIQGLREVDEKASVAIRNLWIRTYQANSERTNTCPLCRSVAPYNSAPNCEPSCVVGQLAKALVGEAKRRGVFPSKPPPP